MVLLKFMNIQKMEFYIVTENWTDFCILIGKDIPDYGDNWKKQVQTCFYAFVHFYHMIHALK